MPQQKPRTQILKRITLPSGKQVDVVSFAGTQADLGADRSTPVTCCPACGHDRVQPTDWTEIGTAHWRVSLRCPDCELRREELFGQDELDEFDIALDEGTRAVAADLDLLARANMADDVERFTNAVTAGHIVPEDF